MCAMIRLFLVMPAAQELGIINAVGAAFPALNNMVNLVCDLFATFNFADAGRSFDHSRSRLGAKVSPV